MKQPISKELVAELQERLEEAIVRVEGGALQASASLTFAVGRDAKTGDVMVKYSLKGGIAKAGDWVAAPTAQEELDLEGEAGPEGPFGDEDEDDDGELIEVAPEAFTPPLYRRLGQVTRHRLSVGEGNQLGAPLCGCQSGKSDAPYERVAENSGAPCRDCEAKANEILDRKAEAA